LAKVDIDELGELSGKYNVQAVPTGEQWFYLLLNTSICNIESSGQLKTYFLTREVPKYFQLGSIETKKVLKKRSCPRLLFPEI
jgi:hypothetical protein